jgi:hypothetical protein
MGAFRRCVRKGESAVAVIRHVIWNSSLRITIVDRLSQVPAESRMTKNRDPVIGAEM